MATRTRLTIGFLIAALMGLVGGCMTTAPTVTLSGPPGPYLIGGAPVTLTATGNPGSSAGLWTYSFSANPACGTFNPVTIGPTDQKTVTTTFSPTVETANCVLEVTLTTASGRTAKASITRAIAGAQIIIIKDAVPNDQQDFSFSATGGLSPATFTLDDDADPTLPNTQTYTGLAPGTYTVTEADPSPGFLLTAINCSAGGTGNVSSRTATITLTPGAVVTCTFVNEKQLGTIVIKKTAVGGDATFSYTSNIPGYATFQITTSGGSGSQTFADLVSGPYTVTESAPPTGWDFTSLVCTDPDNGTTVVGQTANIDLDPGETVTCTYTNTKRGTIVINKATVGGDATFDYTTSGTGGLPATFQITTSSGSGSQTFNNIVPGSHTVTEGAPPANWVFTSLACTDPDGGTTIASQTANIDLDPGETVTCTYTNTYIPPPLPQCPANLIAEAEPNDNNASAQPLNLAPGQGVAIVSGGITPAGDLDYYQITVAVPSLVFAYVRTNLATTSTDPTLFIGVNPVTTGSSCTGTGFAECDDDDGGQGGLSSSIAGLSLSPGTYNILVKQYSATGAPGSGSTMTPYRLYVAVVPTSSVISESEPNNSPSAGQVINSCPAVISGTGGGTEASDYYRFLVPGGNTVLWASAAQPNIGEWNSRLELWRVSTSVKIPFTAAAGSPNCDSASTGLTGNPASESCSMDYNYDSADRWPATPEDYAVNIRRNADPDTGTGGAYYLLIAVMTDVGPTPPPLPPNVPAIFSYAKRGATGNDTVMRLRTTTSGVPVYSGCAAATPPDLECGDDEGHSYTSPADVVYPPTGGGGGQNSAIAGHPFQNIGELIFIQGYSSTTTIGAFDLYIHVPNGSLGQLTEANDTGNGTIAGAEAVPVLPTCTAVYSEAPGSPNPQRPGFGAGGSDNVPVPAPSDGWTMDGSFSSDTDVDYFGPITVGATDRVFIAIDASLDYGGAPHDHNGYNADISFTLRTSTDAVIITIDGDSGTSQGALAEVFSGTPGAHTGGLPGGVFYIRVAAKTGDAFKGYRLTACKFP